jgi:hypothetical protein
MRRIKVLAMLVAMIFVLAQPAAAQSGFSLASLTCLQDLTGRWEVRLVAPGYQRISAFTWNFDSAYLSVPGQWRPATGYWWGGADAVWFSPFDTQSPFYGRWDGPTYNSTVLFGTNNTGHIYVNEWQWNGQAWDGPYSHDCTLTQWVPSVPISWPSL